MKSSGRQKSTSGTAQRSVETKLNIWKRTKMMQLSIVRLFSYQQEVDMQSCSRAGRQRGREVAHVKTLTKLKLSFTRGSFLPSPQPRQVTSRSRAKSETRSKTRLRTRFKTRSRTRPRTRSSSFTRGLSQGTSGWSKCRLSKQ